MATFRTSVWLTAIALIWGQWFAATALADPLSIYDIQYVNLVGDPTGASPQDGNTVDCLGGIVTHVLVAANIGKSTDRVYLQDPAHPNGWGAIAIKDFGGTLAGNVSVGDWVSLTNVDVEDSKANTFFLYDYRSDLGSPSGLIVESSGNPVPPPKAVSVTEIRAPVSTVSGDWLVDDHDAEKYESMWLTVVDVTVTDMNLGAKGDIYNLQNGTGDDAWTTDYLNEDVPISQDYHPSVQVGRQFASVTGILEQYTKATSGWDYYQLLTTSSEDLVVVPEPSAVVMLAGGMIALGLGLARRRRRSRPHN